MALYKGIREFGQATAQYEMVQNYGGSRGGELMRRFRAVSPDELLMATLPHALASEETDLLNAWLRHFARTEP